MIVEKFILTPFQQNTRVVVCEETNQAICIDPGEGSVQIVDFVRDNEYELQAVTLTHGHLDHVGGTLALHEIFPKAEILLHKDDEELYYNLPLQPLALGMPTAQLEALGMKYENPPKLTQNWEHGEIYAVGNLRFKILHCPGHTRGHIILVEESHRKVFVGDCLFRDSIGRTDLPGGSHEQLLNSINTHILPLGDDFTVYSGHGGETTIGREKASNPFLNSDNQKNPGRFV